MNKVSWISDKVRVRWWTVILLELMWNTLAFTFCCNGKVSVWLWKAQEIFFLLLCGHPVNALACRRSGRHTHRKSRLPTLTSFTLCLFPVAMPAVDQFCLTDWPTVRLTPSVRDWSIADHVRHFAATSFSLLQQWCTVDNEIFYTANASVFLLLN